MRASFSGVARTKRSRSSVYRGWPWNATAWPPGTRKSARRAVDNASNSRESSPPPPTTGNCTCTSTDYRSLYVADVEQVSDTDPRAADAAHVPPHTPSAGFSCDCWFRLRDVRALVPGDLKGVAAELSRLRNTHYHDKAVSLHGGMVELPLLVTRPDWRRYFQDGERDLLADGQRWVRFDAEQGGVGALEATLRDDHLGELAWHGLDAAARRFLATALADAPRPARLVHIDGRTVELPGALPLPLGVLAGALGGESALPAQLRRVLTDGAWCTGELAVVLDQFALVRNAAAHGEPVTRAAAVQWRNRLLGVGC